MPIPLKLTAESAQLSLLSESPEDSPLIVHRDTLLGDLPKGRDSDYALVCDDNRRLLGIVPVKEIDRRLQSANPFERWRWTRMPIGAMSPLCFSDSAGEGSQQECVEHNCTAISEGGRLLGLSVNGDLFLSWKRLESLFTAALSDPLTGLMNRLAYERRLREEWDRSLRTSTSAAVVVVDLNDFKHVNDSWGHAVGDMVLRLVGRQLQSAMRSYDVVARFGGDEFVALCLGCAPGDIQIPINRLLQAINDIDCDHEGTPIPVRASVGAAVRHDGFDCALPEDLFIAADQCLYEAKKSDQKAWVIEFGKTDDAVPYPVDSPQPGVSSETNSAKSVV